MGGFSTLGGGGGLTWEEIKSKLENEGAKNKAYDSDVDGVFDIAVIPNMFRTKLLNPYRLRMIRNERVSIAANGTVTIADLTGSGTIFSVWITTSGRGIGRDAILRIYNDGETSPSVGIDLGTLFCSHWTPDPGFQQASTQHIHMEATWDSKNSKFWFSGTMLFIVPFGDGIKIELYNPTSYTGYVWSQVLYTTDVTFPLRLKGKGISWLNKSRVTAGSSYEFMNITGAGWLIWNSMVMVGVTNNSFMEADVEVYIDDETTPSIKSTGTEDWFHASFYWHNTKTYSTPFQMCTVRDDTEHRTVAGLDLLHLCGGIRFNSGLKVVWDYSEPDTDVDISYCFLYYKEV